MPEKTDGLPMGSERIGLVGEPEEQAEYRVKEISARRGDWVEIWRMILPVGERAPQVPTDTAQVPLEMRLRGFLLDNEATLGNDVLIQTRIGREVKGRLVQVNPRWSHDFGSPQPELLAIGQELRDIKRGRG